MKTRLLLLISIVIVTPRPVLLAAPDDINRPPVTAQIRGGVGASERAG